MTTLIDTAQPTDEYLERILQDEALSGRTENDFVPMFMDGIFQRLESSPALYRSFGAWWPELKRLLVEVKGTAQFGIEIEEGTRAIYSRTRPALTIIAAHLYSTERINAGQLYSAYHELDVHDGADDTEPYLYVSSDDELERLIAVKG